MKKVVAIIAYGSLIDDPGREIKLEIAQRRLIETPFKVEFARKSSKRGYAPTLVPVEDGGSVVRATLLILRPLKVSVAKDMLWRRETGNEIGRYAPRHPPSKNTVLIDQYCDFGGVDLAIATRIASNIPVLDGTTLAKLAITSARSSTVPQGENGIAYLDRVKRSGIETPLMKSYEEAILSLLSASDLAEALEIVRRSV